MPVYISFASRYKIIDKIWQIPDKVGLKKMKMGVDEYDIRLKMERQDQVRTFGYVPRWGLLSNPDPPIIDLDQPQPIGAS